ncbi:hypothetical protein GE09DRAFT_402314 [Coniochaeta sp. 2T2.1]|nr:hypothetical protein GE09DRAFT_402314 [Coniochaeta sp. 2T2.1]
MTVPFGFSAGDFIATAGLVKNIISALDNTGGARPAYQRLKGELVAFDGALVRIQSLEVDPTQSPQKVALQMVAAQCRDSIDRFLTKNSKFQRTLGQAAAQPAPRRRTSRWRTGLHKLEWALMKEKSVDALRAEVAGHAATLNIILNLIQAGTLKKNGDAVQDCVSNLTSITIQGRETNALAVRSHDHLLQQAEMIASVCRTVTTSTAPQGRQDQPIQKMVQQVLDCNFKVYSAVVEMQKTIRSHLPRQIERNQPVYFEDAHGRVFPLHVEFVDSYATFQGVLEIKFGGVPGLDKIRRHEYVVGVAGSGGEILDMEKGAWSAIFRPGTWLNMSMVFYRRYEKPLEVRACPSCGTAGGVTRPNDDGVTLCPNPPCGLLYRRLSQPLRRPTLTMMGRTQTADFECLTVNDMKRRTIQDGSTSNRDEIRHFRRVVLLKFEVDPIRLREMRRSWEIGRLSSRLGDGGIWTKLLGKEGHGTSANSVMAWSALILMFPTFTLVFPSSLTFVSLQLSLGGLAAGIYGTRI